MKICTQCHSTFWPYLIAAFLAGFAAFLTWLTLGYSEFDATEQIIGAVGMFLVAGATLTHYMMACMQRHCHHHEHHHHRRHQRHGRKLEQRPPPVGA